ncbi:Sna3 protein [Maudiozyma humilis]|uniref:Sna3 protein n=1 Tax=Maudiozyma humilis TaxID=51915 RepID=A0AAV5S4H3_MAUHU|nr:Sna3 protein [Kazachstania humilis]
MSTARYSINKDDLLLVILAVFVPPVPVIIRRGLCNKDTLLNLLLFMVLFFPATIHSFYVIYETSKERDGERERGSTQEDRVPLTNGDFSRDLEAGRADAGAEESAETETSADLPRYDEVASSTLRDDFRGAGDNKQQH